MNDTITTRTYSADAKSRDVHPRESERDETQQDETQVCPECSGHLVTDEEHGGTICEDCGLVVEDTVVDRGPEWRTFDSAERDGKPRVGAPTTKMMHDKGLSTNISWQNKDAYGKSLSPRQREQMQRLRAWNEWSRTRDSKGRNLKQALGEIDRMASALDLPENVRETASVIYRRALNDDLLPGRSIGGVAISVLYASTQMAGTPRSLDELEKVLRVDKTELTRAYHYIVRELKLEIKSVDPEQHVPRLVSELGLSDEAGRQARQLLRDAKETGTHSGRSPVGLAAAAVHAAAPLTNEKVTQSEVSTVADISGVTIRSRYKELFEAQNGTLLA